MLGTGEQRNSHDRCQQGREDDLHVERQLRHDQHHRTRASRRLRRPSWWFSSGWPSSWWSCSGPGGLSVWCRRAGRALAGRQARRRGWKQTLVKVGRGPEGFDVSPDGKQLWTGHMGDGKISVVDLASKKAVKTIDAGQALNRLKFTPDGSLALVSDIFGGELIIIDVASQAVKARVKVGRGASGILIPPDGSRFRRVDRRKRDHGDRAQFAQGSRPL